MTNTPDTRFTTYARKAADGFLRSWAHYSQTFVQVADFGGPATPAYYSNMLAKAVHMLDDTAALTAAKEAAIARDGHAFAIWEFYANDLAGRLPLPCECVGRRAGDTHPHSVHCTSYRPLVAVWTPEDYAQTVADAQRIGR
jgi:hypothetical protein